MIYNFPLQNIFKYSLCLLISIITFLQINVKNVNSLIMDTTQGEFVTEELRLKIPSDYKEEWLEAEKNIWEPWLSKKDGFLARQIFWDKEKEEALILVNWKNKKLWKNIPEKEVYQIQRRFEENVKKSLDLKENPFKLIYEGELQLQG